MTRVCSTCSNVFGLIAAKAGLSHGICPACYPAVRVSFGLEPKAYPYPEQSERKAGGAASLDAPPCQVATSVAPRHPIFREPHELTEGSKALSGATTEPRAESHPVFLSDYSYPDTERGADGAPSTSKKGGDPASPPAPLSALEAA
jgi:hypothetical protein